MHNVAKIFLLLYYEKLDRCIERSIENFFIGSGAGLSTLILSRRGWFVSLGVGLGAGAGLGLAYAQCSQDFSTPLLCHCTKIKKRDITPAEQSHDQQPPVQKEQQTSKEGSAHH